MRLKLLLFCLLFGCVTAFAQDNTLSGHVMRQGDKSPVRGAVITIKGTSLHTLSGQDGSYLFENLEDGQVVLLVNAAGYLTREAVVDVDGGDNVCDLVLRPMNFGSMSENNSYAFTESQIDEDADVAASTASIITSSTNMYLNEVGYLFSPMRFRVRAYDSQYSGTLSSSYYVGHHRDMWKTWNPETGKGELPIWDAHTTSSYTQSSDAHLISASYFSLRNVTIGYTFPAKWMSKLGIQSIRVFVSGDNVALVSARQGFDPRVAMSGQNDDYGGYSPIRTISGGININF